MAFTQINRCPSLGEKIKIKQNNLCYSYPIPNAANSKNSIIKANSGKISKYEKLTLLILLSTWGILVLVIYGLHISFYSLETKTSSKSPTHSLFYKLEAPNAPKSEPDNKGYGNE